MRATPRPLNDDLLTLSREIHADPELAYRRSPRRPSVATDKGLRAEVTAR
ncbi:MAG: hypothetical protein HYX56_05305 [Chloroflexi bacterium]|nr:hypothetical protein [Chloroflexota bacterium]